MDRQKVLAEIKQTLGLVPNFFQLLSDAALEVEWNTYKQVELVEGVIPGKYRELIGVAVAGAIGCQYCAIYHTEVGRLQGASDQEIEAAAYQSKNAVGWGTYMSGVQLDGNTFRDELRQVCDRIRSSGGAKAQIATTVGPLSRGEVFKEMEQAFGLVPSVFKRLSDQTLAANWAQVKLTMFSPSPIPPKYLQLIGLGVSSVRGDHHHSVQLYTELAKAFGATDAEIEETVHMAKMSSGWSSYVHCLQLDIGQFRQDVRQVCEHMRKSTKAGAKEPAMAGRR